MKVALLVGWIILALGAHPGRAQLCVGDCDRNASVAIQELILGVNITLGNADVSRCPAYEVTPHISDLIRAVRNALDGCVQTSTATATEDVGMTTATATPTDEDGTRTVPQTELPTASPTPISTATLATTATETGTTTPTATATDTPTITNIPTHTHTPTNTHTPTHTWTHANTPLPTNTPNPTANWTAAPIIADGLCEPITTMTDCFRRFITRFDRCYACPNTLNCGASGTSDYNTVVGKCSCYPGAVPNQCGTLGVCGLTGEGNMGATRLCASGPQSECTEDSQCVTGYCVKRFCNIGFAGTPDQGSKTPPNTFNSCTQGGPVYQCNAFSDGYESGGVCGAGDKCSAGRIETTPVELMISLHDYSQASINTRTGHCLEKTSESCPPPLPAERYSYLWNHVCRAGVESGLWESCKPCDTARWTWEGSLLPKFRAVQMCYQRDVVRPIMNAVADTVVALGLTNACAAAVNNSMGWTMFSSFVEGGQGDFKSQIGSRNACSGCQPMEMYEGIDGGLAFFYWHSRGNSIQSDCVGSPNTPGDMTNPDAGEFSFNDAKALWESVQPIGMAVQRGWTIAKGSVRTPYPTLTATPSPTP